MLNSERGHCLCCKQAKRRCTLDGRRLCPACARQADNPVRAPDGHVLAPPLRRRCANCGDTYWTTVPTRTRCANCPAVRNLLAIPSRRPPEAHRLALVCFYATALRGGATVESVQGPLFAWLIDWALAFPADGGTPSDSARRRIVDTLRSAGRADLLPPALHSTP